VKSNPEKERFDQLIETLIGSIEKDKKQIRDLRKENQSLKQRLEQMHMGQADIFSVMGESERMTLKNQVLQLIQKVDRHLKS
jgi:fatty acid/phospholipid biosynthesis enzyme